MEKLDKQLEASFRQQMAQARVPDAERGDYLKEGRVSRKEGSARTLRHFLSQFPSLLSCQRRFESGVKQPV